ncbi:MAG: phosphomannomutase/phosphoglucomutase [Bacilli bacterium]|nr:phosphomannomutase/phosphoglucomutase [Bacilli bacterium]
MEITKNINPNIFREYDLRGIAETDLTEDVAYTLGKSYGTYMTNQGQTKVIIGHDNRTTSPMLNNALIKGIIETGVDVVSLGLVTTPMYYFAKIYYGVEAGIMITASHNPKEYNGFKISFSKIGNACGKLIEDFKDFTYKQEFITKENGQITKKDIKEAYLENFKKSINLGNRKIKVVVDCGNGTGSIIIKNVLDMFDIDYELIYCDSNPEFPNHTPDPAVSEYMIDLGKKVKETNSDFGIGIDGDADRVGVVDENGNFLTADLLMLIIYRHLNENLKNRKGLFDVKCSRTLIDGLNQINIEPVMNRTGNSYQNIKMQEGDFDFGGEYSGHFYFRDKYQGFDDGIYAGLRIIELLSKTDYKFSELLNNTNKYYSTEETKVKVTEENKFNIVKGIKEYVENKNYKYEDIDGIRVEFDDSWGLIRASNTGPNLTIRFEAKTEDRLKEIETEFTNEINKQIKLNN